MFITYKDMWKPGMWILYKEHIFIARNFKGTKFEELILFHEKTEMEEFKRITPKEIQIKLIEIDKEYGAFDNDYSDEVNAFMQDIRTKYIRPAHLFARQQEKIKYPKLFVEFQNVIH